MKARLAVALFTAALIPAYGFQKPGKAVAPPRAPRQASARPAQQNAAQGRGQAGSAPAMEQVRRLARMSPEEQQKALANLPPERREAMTRRLQNFQKMPPAARQRAAYEVEKLQSLPPQRQNQVRRSLRQFQELPEDRKAAIGAELDRLNAMPEEDRRARMNSEEFRNRYSPAEQQMMSNISEVLPPRREE